MITKADIEKRIAELKEEQVKQIIATDNTYSGAIQELERLLSSFDSSENNKKEK